MKNKREKQESSLQKEHSLFRELSSIILFILVFIGSTNYVSSQTVNQGDPKFVKGVVSDQNGQTLPSVSVVEKGTSNGTLTDLEGKFNIAVKEGATLVFSYVGYETYQIKIGAKSDYAIKLDEDQKALDEVVVVAFGTARKRDLTGSVSSISAENIKMQQVSTISRALEGAVPGLQFSNKSGQPGATSEIQIRGMGSISAGNGPLVVVDGSTSVNWQSLNPSDIESVVVSKDATSNSLYGARAANGVILITTKKGKGDKPRINLDFRFGATSRGISDYDKIDDPAQYYEFTWEGIYNYVKYFPSRDNKFKNMTDQQLRQYASDNLFKANGNSTSARNYLGNYMLYNIPDGTTLIDPTTGKLRSDAQLLYHDDWEDYFLKTSFRQEYNASVSGATNKSDYYFSLGYLSDPSYVMGSEFKRYSARINANTSITNWLKSGLAMSYSRTYSDTPNYTGGTVNNNLFAWLGYFGTINPLFAHDQAGNIINDANGKPTFDLGTNQTYSPYGTTGRMAFNGYSPGIYFEKDYNTTTTDYFNGSTYIQASFLNDFIARADLSFDASFPFTKTYGNNESGTAARDLNGSIYNRFDKSIAVNTTQTLTWNRNFGDHHLDVLVGHEYKWWRSDYAAGTKSNMFAIDKPSLENAIRINSFAGAGNSYSLEGYLSRLNYNFKEKYYLTGSLRYDGSSYFRDNRWGTFWSAGGSYRISQEDFMKSTSSWLSELKLRANYGIQGNNNIGAWRYTDIWAIQNNGSIGSPVLGITQESWANPYLTWEKNKVFNAGIDFQLWKRLYGSVDYFHRTTTDLLWGVPLPASTGRSGRTENVGSIMNTGIEIDLGVDIIRTNNLKWTFTVNASHFNNELKKKPSGVGSTDLNGDYVQGNYLRGVGKDYYNFYMYKYAGVDPETGLGMLYKELKATDDLSKYPGKKVGDIITTTVGTEATKFELGSASPDLVGGFGTTLKYKDFDFSLLASWQIGGQVVDLSYQGLTGNTIGRAYHTDLLDAWTPENKGSNIPMRMLGGTNYGSNPIGGSEGQYSDFALFDASYLNMKSITLGYTIPAPLTRKWFVDNLRVYISAENLFLLSAKKGLDPRTSLDGGSSVGAFGFPQSRVISFGVNVGI